MQSQTKIFSRLVRDYMRTPPVAVPDDTDVETLLAHMAAAKATSAPIVDANGRLTGIITEQDITRRVALRCAGSERVRAVMTAPVETVAADDYLYAAIARMRRFDWRHMPVVDAKGKPVGTIVLEDALAVAAEQIVRQIDRITHEGTLDGLREIKAAQAIVDAIENAHPSFEVVVSSSTDTGMDVARKLLPENHVVRFPADLALSVSRFPERVDPSFVLLVELEIWPNFLRKANRMGIPVAIVSGRITESSFENYKRFRSTLPQFNRITVFAAQNERYAERFKELARSDERVVVTGNVKIDGLKIGPAPRDDAYRELDSLSDMGLSGAGGLPPEARYGGAASNLARLETILEGDLARYREPGLAVPVRYFFEFLEENSVVLDGRELTYREYLEELVASVEFQEDSELRSQSLRAFRELARAGGVENPGGTRHCRNFQGPGKDGPVRGRPAVLRNDRGDLLGLERGKVRGQQMRGHHHGALGQRLGVVPNA